MNEFLAKGCLPDIKDDRDKIYEDIVVSTTNMTENYDIDLRDEFMPKIYDQKQYGSCVAHSILRSYEYQLNKLYKTLGLYSLVGGKADCKYSRQFLYYMSRLLSGTVRTDGGANPRSGCKAIKKWGIPEEWRHPYNIGWKVQPSSDAIIYADDHKITSYYRITSFEGIVHALKQGIPVLISTDVYKFKDAKENGFSKSALSWNTKITPSEVNHEMVICGIKTMDYLGKQEDCFIIANSWGEGWGCNGYCYIPARKMWDYNIYDVWVVIVDKNSLTQDNEVSEPIIEKDDKTIMDKIPSDSIVATNIGVGYAKEYLKALFSSNKSLYDKIIANIDKNIDKIIFKDKDGNCSNPLGYEIKVIGEIKYYDKDGRLITIK